MLWDVMQFVMLALRSLLKQHYYCEAEVQEVYSIKGQKASAVCPIERVSSIGFSSIGPQTQHHSA